jgi:hypothetical protein
VTSTLDVERERRGVTGCLQSREMISMLDVGGRGGNWAFFCKVRFENKQLMIIKILSYIEMKTIEISAR